MAKRSSTKTKITWWPELAKQWHRTGASGCRSGASMRSPATYRVNGVARAHLNKRMPANSGHQLIQQRLRGRSPPVRGVALNAVFVQADTYLLHLDVSGERGASEVALHLTLIAFQSYPIIPNSGRLESKHRAISVDFLTHQWPFRRSSWKPFYLAKQSRTSLTEHVENAAVVVRGREHGYTGP
jgi:hypothetical protein